MIIIIIIVIIIMLWLSSISFQRNGLKYNNYLATGGDLTILRYSSATTISRKGGRSHHHRHTHHCHHRICHHLHHHHFYHITHKPYSWYSSAITISCKGGRVHHNHCHHSSWRALNHLKSKHCNALVISSFMGTICHVIWPEHKNHHKWSSILTIF